MDKIRIGYDAKRLFCNRSGLGVYARSLIYFLANANSDFDFYLYTPSVNAEVDHEWFWQQENIHIRLYKGKQKSYWRTKAMVDDLVQDKIQIYHGLASELPLGIEQTGIKTVVTIHDVIHKYFPLHYGIFDRWVYDWKIKNALKKADKIVSVSKATTSDIHKFFGKKAPKIDDRLSLIYELTHPSYYADNEANVPDIGYPYYLFIGDSNPRKNLNLVLKAFNSICNRNDKMRLVITAPYPELIERMMEHYIRPHKDKVIIMHDTSNETLKTLYTHAICLLYPSDYEGFGLPLLEAQLCRCPVITTNRNPFTEVANPDNTVFLPTPLHERELQISMSQLYQNRDEIRLPMQLPKKLQIDTICGQYLEIYDQLISSKK